MQVIEIIKVLENSLKEKLKSAFFLVVLDVTCTIEVHAVPMFSAI